jgi:hypothetical protein
MISSTGTRSASSTRPPRDQRLQTIVAAADNPAVAGQIAAGTLPPELDAAYQALFAEAGLGAGGVTAPPGADQEGFAPLETAREWMSAGVCPSTARAALATCSSMPRRVRRARSYRYW